MNQFEDTREMQRDGETEKSLGQGSCVYRGLRQCRMQEAKEARQEQGILFPFLL